MGKVSKTTLLVIYLMSVPAILASPTVPTEIEQPGTQPGEVGGFSTNCDSCHAGTPNPAFEPSFGWHGSMMSQSMRDPLFWATVAVAEQDFLPNPDPTLRGGVGDLCLRCHGPAAWLGGRSTPTDGSALSGADERGVECEFCHLAVDPDQALSIPGTVEEQNAPYEAFDGATGEGYYGSGQYVINGNGTRLGPYDDASANHQWIASPFLRSGDFCGTCHDVSNPAVGDLAHNHGAQVPLSTGFSGVPGSPVEGKAAFNHAPYRYGVVERTYSEWKSGAWSETRVSSLPSLPIDLQVSGGAPSVAYVRAFDVVPPSANPNRPDYVDGTPRFYTCQTCHMSASTGKGCNKNNAPIRYDLPRHDMTGGAYWMPDVLQYQFNQNTMVFGSLTQNQIDALDAGKSRAANQLGMAASLDANRVGSALEVRVTNLTGHKLISGYPEGRRMWLNVKWFDAGLNLIHEDGAYGPIGRSVNDLAGAAHQVESILDLDDTLIYAAKPGMDQEWANQLLALSYDPDLVLEYDRLTDEVHETLGDLAAEEAGHIEHTFHFVLNNVIDDDNRIPPYGFRYDDAQERNCLPVPPSRYGDPGPGGIYEHWDDATFPIPVGAETAEVRLYYQQTSWEYIQFLWLANDGQNPTLGDEGVNLLDAWLNTGMSPPFEMKMTTVAVGGVTGAPGEASRQDIGAELMTASLNPATGWVDIEFVAACDSADHAIYFGDLANVSGYGYSDAECSVGVTGSATFDAGPQSTFFLVVGYSDSAEGSYGKDSDGLERAAAPVECGLTQDLSGTCDAP